MKNDDGSGTGANPRRKTGGEACDADIRARRRYAYFRRKYSGGRSVVARAVDYVALRLIILAAAYLFFLPRFGNWSTALLLAGIALGIAMLVLRMMREIALERFVRREIKRIRKTLLCDRLMLADVQTVGGLSGRLCPQTERAVVLQRALPVDAEALLALVRTYRGYGKLHVFSCTEYADSAVAFSMRANGLLELHAPEELLSAAVRAGMEPPMEAVYAYIEAEQRDERKRRRLQRMRVSPFAAARAKKYLLAALVLTGASFLTRYALYYRMLAGLCAVVAACGAAMARGARTLQGAGDIG